MNENVNMKIKRNSDVLMYSITEPCDDYGAPMSNDCQGCGCAQAHARRSISLDYPDMDKAANGNEILLIYRLPRRPNER
jgi:hypothetical protein